MWNIVKNYLLRRYQIVQQKLWLNNSGTIKSRENCPEKGSRYHEKPKIQKGNSKWHLTNKERGLYEAEKSKKIKNARNRYHIMPEERRQKLKTT